MTNKKQNNKKIYALVGVVSLIIFIGYDGFFHEEVELLGRGGSWKSKMGGALRWSIWKLGEDHLWLYITFRGLFLVIALWMGYKIYKVTRKGIS